MRVITLESSVTDLDSKILLAFLCSAYIVPAFQKYLISEIHLENIMHFDIF